MFFFLLTFLCWKTWAGHAAPRMCGSTVDEGNTPLTFVIIVYKCSFSSTTSCFRESDEVANCWRQVVITVPALMGWTLEHWSCQMRYFEFTKSLFYKQAFCWASQYLYNSALHCIINCLRQPQMLLVVLYWSSSGLVVPLLSSMSTALRC